MDVIQKEEWQCAMISTFVNIRDETSKNLL